MADAQLIVPAVPYTCPPSVNPCTPLVSYWSLTGSLTIETDPESPTVSPLALYTIAEYVRLSLHQGNVFPTVGITGRSSPFRVTIQFPFAIQAEKPPGCVYLPETGPDTVPPPVPVPLFDLAASSDAIAFTANTNFAEDGIWNAGLVEAAQVYIGPEVISAVIGDVTGPPAPIQLPYCVTRYTLRHCPRR